ncbi:MAG: SGNH/GDSL hydrolase family protein [Breznakibacter sp.]
METPNPRRYFLKKAGLLAASAAVLPNVLAYGQPKEDKINVLKRPQTVLFIGDSITDGNRTRDNDWNHVLGHGYAQMLAARLWFDHPQRFAMFYNRGISGNTVGDLAGRWQADVIDLKPDVVSILVGINDVYGIVKGYLSQTPDEFERIYRIILETTGRELPNARLVICEPFILPGGRVEEKPDVWERETSVRREITQKLAREFNAVFVPLQEPFTDALHKAPAKHWIWDGIHPMPGGHELIAREWLKKVKL